MTTKLLSLLFCSIVFTAMANAKSFHLNSIDQGKKSFSLTIYCTDEGKAALVQYMGKTDYLALRLKKFTTSVLTNTSKQPEGYYYEWDELVNGKITGSYGVFEQSGKITDAWYMRNKDGRRFKLTGAAKNDSRNEIQKYLLHNVLITFAWTSADDQFMFTYPDGKVVTLNFPSLDAPEARRSCYIKDYNFDGYNDIAFSLPDAGMGVYQTFNIWLYDPATKRFQPLQETQDARAKCSCLCDVTLNAKEKLLYTACRGGARWWQDVYRIGKNNHLIWLRSSEKR